MRRNKTLAVMIYLNRKKYYLTSLKRNSSRFEGAKMRGYDKSKWHEICQRLRRLLPFTSCDNSCKIGYGKATNSGNKTNGMQIRHPKTNKG